MQSGFMNNLSKKVAKTQQRTPQSIDKYQQRSRAIRNNNYCGSAGSPLDFKGKSPHDYSRQRFSNSPNSFKGLNFPYQISVNQPNKQFINLAFTEYTSQNQLNNLNINYSTKDNTKLTIANCNTNSSASTIMAINNGFNSNLTVDFKPDQYQNQDSTSDKKQGPHKPPLIPSLKAKIYQTALGGSGAQQTSKSIIHGMSALTGITDDNKLTLPEGHSRTAGAGSIHNFQSVNIMSTVSEEHIQQRDLQSVVEFKMKEDSKQKQFINSRSPFLFIDMQSQNQNNNYQLNHYNMLTNLQEMDRSISETNQQHKQRLDQAYPSYESWLQDMKSRSDKQKLKIA